MRWWEEGPWDRAVVVLPAARTLDLRGATRTVEMR